jgi:hypothetical protein
VKLDFYSDEGFVFLPTEGNNTKVSWASVTALPELKEAPATVLALLRTMKSKVADGVKKSVEVKHTISNRLAPMLTAFLTTKKYDPVLFRVITPYSFRDLPTYVKQGHMHPDNVPQGRGSEYLSKISAILGADISVNREMYMSTMMLINNLWSNPMDKEPFMKTIINPMLEERATVDGQVIWQYDEHWEQMGFIATSLNGEYLESFYDDVKGLYYLVNYNVPYIKVYSEKRACITTLKTLLGRSITESQYDSTKQLIRTKLNPSLEFGHIEGTDGFNLFRQTEELGVLNNPSVYTKRYSRPIVTLAYLESLIPDDFMRSYVLSFLRTKLTTFRYSPIVLYMIGKPGSGKDTLVEIMRRIIGAEYVAKPDTKVFLEQYNGWLLDKYFVQLDEYGNKLVRHSEKQETLGRIKAYTGSEEVQIRAMRNDGFNYRHAMTFILTANSNPLPIESDDRRIAFIKTPNRLDRQDWVKELGGIRRVQELIEQETLDFCYYMATEVHNLPGDQYVIAPDTEDKEKMVLDAMPAAEQITYYVQHGRYTELVELAEEYGIDGMDNDWENNKLLDTKIEELYNVMTEGNGSHRTVIKQLKAAGINRSHTTRNGQNLFYYFLPDIHTAKVRSTGEFQPIEYVEKVTPKGL